MQREPERDLIVAWQQGNLTAARQLVAMLQSEALAVAYLLTGERQNATAVAEAGLLALFQHSRSGDPDIDRRNQLLTLLAQTYLGGDYKARLEQSDPALLPEPSPAHFNVDNRRSLLLAALGRLESRERTALILHDFSGLDASDLTTLARHNNSLIGALDAARARVRQSIDVPANEPLRRSFAEASMDAPRVDLWPRLEGSLADILRRERTQSRIISAGIVAVAVIILLAGSLALFGDMLFGEQDEAESAVAEPTELPLTVLGAPAMVQPARIEPTDTPAGPTYPDASVPGWLLLETWHQANDDTEAYRSLTVFDPGTNRTQLLPGNSPIHLAAGSDHIRFSPDGSQMVIFREQVAGDEMRYFVTSYSTARINRQWESSLITIDRDPELDPGAHVPIRLSAAVTEDRVFVAALTTGEEPTLTAYAFDRDDGSRLGSVEVDLPPQRRGSMAFHGNVLLHAPPESDTFYLIIESFGGAVEDWRAALLTFDRSELTLIGERSISADLNEGYWLWSSQMTPDGSALYGVHRNRSGTESRVQFLELETGEVTTLSLPFTTPASENSDGMTPVASHDGQRIYVLDQTGSDVAVVNLAQRRIERIFPLDRRGFETDFPANANGLMFGYWSALSVDGTQLYIASWDQDPEDNAGRSGIWVVDTSRWRLTHFIPVEGFVNGLFLAPAENDVYAQVWKPADEKPAHDIVKVVTNGQPDTVEALDLPQHGDGYVWARSPAQFFQAQFGRSPAIDDIPLEDTGGFATLPRLDTQQVSDVVVPNQTTTIEVRVLDPETGEPLTSERDDVRFDASAGVTAFVHAPEQEQQIVVLAEVRPGIYHGSIVLPQSGRWTVDVALTDDAGDRWVANAIGQVDVSPLLAGSDDRQYVFKVTTDPDQPVADEETLVRLSVVDPRTGEPLPDGVTVTIPAENEESIGLPDSIDIPLMHSEPGYLTARLDTVGNGIYEGMVRFWAPGPWSAFIRIPVDDQVQITIPVNRIRVSEPE